MELKQHLLEKEKDIPTRNVDEYGYSTVNSAMDIYAKKERVSKIQSEIEELKYNMKTLLEQMKQQIETAGNTNKYRSIKLNETLQELKEVSETKFLVLIPEYFTLKYSITCNKHRRNKNMEYFVGPFDWQKCLNLIRSSTKS